MKLSKETIAEIRKITRTNYESKKGYIPLENVESLLDDLIAEVRDLQEQIEKLKNNTDEQDYDEISKDIRLGIYD